MGTQNDPRRHCPLSVSRKKYVMEMRGKIQLDKGHLEFGRQWRCGGGAAYLRRQTVDLAQDLRRFNSEVG